EHVEAYGSRRDPVAVAEDRQGIPGLVVSVEVRPGEDGLLLDEDLMPDGTVLGPVGIGLDPAAHHPARLRLGKRPGGAAEVTRHGRTVPAGAESAAAAANFAYPADRSRPGTGRIRPWERRCPSRGRPDSSPPCDRCARCIRDRAA